MKVVKFRGYNSMMGEDQPEYENLPAFRADDKVGSLVMCFELNEEEKKQVAETGLIYLKQITYGTDMAPIVPSLLAKDNIPTLEEINKAKKTIEEKRDQLVKQGTQKNKLRAIHKKIGRNDLCPCGSGKKWKKCHMSGKKTLNKNKLGGK